MAVSDEDRARRTDDYIDTDLAREANPVTLIAVLLLGGIVPRGLAGALDARPAPPRTIRPRGRARPPPGARLGAGRGRSDSRLGAPVR